MPKRKGEHSLTSTVEKKAKKGEDPCGKFLSLAAADDTLLAGLTYFLTRVQRDGDTGLIEQYLERHPECDHILTPLTWDRDRRTQDVLLLCFHCLEQVLLYTASPSSSNLPSTSTLSHSPGTRLVQTILKNHMRPIYSSLLTAGPNKLIAACLHLLAAMVTQGLVSAREVQLVFNFGYKPLQILPNRTNRIQGTSETVRLCFLKFALSFLVVGDNEVIRAILQLKGFLSSMFKLLPNDSAAIIHLFLSTLLQKVILNPGVNKKIKSRFFNLYVLKQTAQLLSRKEETSVQVTDNVTGSTVSLRQFVFDFLVMLCTDLQHGICYRSKDLPLGLERTNNPVILQLLLSLTGSIGDTLVRDLITMATATCPDLVLPFLRSLSFSFEPRPTSKWVNNMDFIMQLFDSLPPLPSLLGISSPPHPPLSHVSVSVRLTAPMVTTRSLLSQGIQNSTLLVKLKALSLIQLILKRAAAVTECFQGQERKGGGETFLVQYCDGVLKQLPDMKTVITVRQQLLAGGGKKPKQVVEGEEGGRDNLTPVEKHLNTELAEDSTLLALTLAIMSGYQKLSPTIFAQVNFSITKLLPPSPSSLHDYRSHDSHVMAPTLQLLLDAPQDSLKWQQQNSTALSSLMWLLLSRNGEVSSLAKEVLLKLLLGTDVLRGYPLELEVLLSTIRDHHLTIPYSFDDIQCLVAMVTGVSLAVVKEPYVYVEMVECEGMEVDGGGRATQGRSQLLQEILDAALEVPVMDGEDMEITTSSIEMAHREDRKRCGGSVCPLLPCLLAKFVGRDPGPLLMFIGSVLLKQLLVQEKSEEFSRLVLHYLANEEARGKYQDGSWNCLYQALLQYFSWWTPSSPEVSFDCVGLSTKKAQKKLRNVETAAEALLVFSSMKRDDLIGCLPVAMETPLLQQAVIGYLSIRPLCLVESLEAPHVPELLTSLPFTTVVHQTITAATGGPDSSAAVISLLKSFAEEKVRDIWRQGLDSTCSDLELTCSVRAVVMILHILYEGSKGTSLGSGEKSATKFLFDLLSKVILKAKNRTAEPETMATNLTAAIFGSEFLRCTFLSGESGSTSEGSKVARERHRRKKKDVIGQNVFFSRKIGTLLMVGLEHCPEFKETVDFCYFSEKLMSCLARLLEEDNGDVDSDIGGLVLGLFQQLHPYINQTQLVSLCESLLVSTPHSSAGLFASILQTILTHLKSCLQLSDSALNRLVDYTIFMDSGQLDAVLYGVLTHQIHRQSSHLTPAGGQYDHLQSSNFIEGVKSHIRRLLSSLDGNSQNGIPAAASIHMPSQPQSSLMNELPSDIAEKFEKILPALHSKTKAKGLLDPIFCDTCFSHHHIGPMCTSTSWLPEDLVLNLLRYCLKSPTIIRTNIAALLVRMSDSAFEHFTSEVPRLCKVVASEGDGGRLCVWVHLLEQYLSVMERRGREEEGTRPDWRGAVTTVRKRAWQRCADLISDTNTPPELQVTCTALLQLLCSLSSKARKRFKRLVTEWYINEKSCTRSQLSLVAKVTSVFKDPDLVGLVVRVSVQQLMVMLSEGRKESSEEERRVVEQLCEVVQGCDCLEADLDSDEWSAFVHCSLRLRFTQPSILNLLTHMIRLVYTNSDVPRGHITVETVYEMVWSHSEFLSVMCSSHDQTEATRLAIVKEKLVQLLVVMVDIHPSVCRTAHIAVLLSAYSATRSKTDQGLLYLLFQYEQNGASVGDYRPFLWGPAALEQYKIKQEVGWLLWKQPETQEVIEQLDKDQLSFSTENFPLEVGLEPSNPFTCYEEPSLAHTNLYDPCFLLPLLSHLLDPGCLVDCHQFVGSGCLGYLITSLSSKCEDVRSAGCHALSRFCGHLEGSKFKEKAQIALLLEVLRNSIQEKNARLPSLFTVFASRTAQLFLHPEHHLYQVIAHLIVYKPALDLGEIPLLYMMLHSSSPQHNLERSWMLKVLVDGLRCKEDYSLYHKKRVISQVMALHDSSLVDKRVKALVLQLVQRACSIPVVATDLVWNQGLLVWLKQTEIRDKQFILETLSTLWSSLGGTNQPTPPVFQEELTMNLYSVTFNEQFHKKNSLHVHV